MKFSFSFLVICFIGISCHNNNAPDLKTSPDRKEKMQSSQVKSIRECIVDVDTVINGNNFIKTVANDSFFLIKVRVGGLDTLLGFKFDCSVPPALVPTFYSYYKEAMCLIRGYGSDYREFLIAYVSDGKILLKSYETALSADLKRNVVVYQNYDNPRQIVVEKFKSGRKWVHEIPSGIRVEIAPYTIIKNSRIELTFSNGDKARFSIY